jgi:hypothetical protein
VGEHPDHRRRRARRLNLETTALGVLPHRLPPAARAQIPDEQLAMAEAQPSGVRLAFRTRATAVELNLLPTKMAYVDAPPRPDGVYDLLVDGQLAGQPTVPTGEVRTTDMTTGTVTTQPGPVGTARFDGLSAEPKGQIRKIKPLPTVVSVATSSTPRAV